MRTVIWDLSGMRLFSKIIALWESGWQLPVIGPMTLQWGMLPLDDCNSDDGVQGRQTTDDGCSSCRFQERARCRTRRPAVGTHLQRWHGPRWSVCWAEGTTAWWTTAVELLTRLLAAPTSVSHNAVSVVDHIIIVVRPHEASHLSVRRGRA